MKSIFKVFAAAVFLGAVGNLQPLQPPAREALREQVDAMGRDRQYTMMARLAAQMIIIYPDDAPAYAAWIIGHALSGRVDKARAAIKVARRRLPQDVVRQYGDVITRIVDRIEEGHAKRAQAARDAEAERYDAAAENLAAAYDALEDDRLGLQAAQLWTWLLKPDKAAPLYRRLAERGDADNKDAAAQFFTDYAAALTRLALSKIDDGWTVINGNEPIDWAKADQAFAQAITFQPNLHALYRAGLLGSRNPYTARAMAAAAQDDEPGIQTHLIAGAAGGMVVPTDPLPRAGWKLGVALCDSGMVYSLSKTFGNAFEAWAAQACADADAEKTWADAVAIFNDANRAGVDSRIALKGFASVLPVFQTHTGAHRADAAKYALRAKCNAVFLKAWVMAVAPSPDIRALARATEDARQCPTLDFDQTKLDTRVKPMRAAAARNDMVALTVCNRTTEDTISVAAMRNLPDDLDNMTRTGWWTIARDQCIDIQATFGLEDETQIYLTASSRNFEWWPVDRGDMNHCVPSSRFNRPEVQMGAGCAANETGRGFRRLTLRKSSVRNGMTYNFKNP